MHLEVNLQVHQKLSTPSKTIGGQEKMGDERSGFEIFVRRRLEQLREGVKTIIIIGPELRMVHFVVHLQLHGKLYTPLK